MRSRLGIVALIVVLLVLGLAAAQANAQPIHKSGLVITAKVGGVHRDGCPYANKAYTYRGYGQHACSYRGYGRRPYSTWNGRYGASRHFDHSKWDKRDARRFDRTDRYDRRDNRWDRRGF